MKCFIERDEFLIEDVLRPGVRNNMVEIQQQDVIALTQLEQSHAQQWPARQVKWTFILSPHGLGYPVLLRGLTQIAQLVHRNIDPQFRENNLRRLTFNLSKMRAQNLMTFYDRVYCLLQ